jgi:BlaI family transcriptional regulator, penicillinase repressor
VAAAAVKCIIDWLCNGSVEELLLGMVDHAVLDRRQFQDLAQTIKQVKNERTKHKEANEGPTKKRSRRGGS